MLGLILFAVIGLWIFISVKLSKWFFRNTEPPSKRRLWTNVVLVLLLVAPVADEVVGGVQFYGLCKKYGRKESQFAAIVGKTVRIDSDPYEDIDGTLLPIIGSRQIYRDPELGTPLVTFMSYTATGGWLIRALHVSETNSPILFPNSCGPVGDESVQGWMTRYQIKAIFVR